ncbi:MAG: porin [Betaproteobacteria bacterium]|nr:porin [Betaproteobacteria bacterium]MBI2959104.1 porin [Betaproteobacteria bacterium]
MKKKVMALVVAGALAAPAAAFAQASNVQIYGRANLGLDNYSATGSTAGAAADLKSRTRIFDSGSRLGFRGSENLGSGLSAVFQIESGVNVDAGNNLGQAGLVNGSSGFLASRDSYVGLQGGWGRVSFGRQTIWNTNGVVAQSGSNYVNTEIPWTLAATFGRVAGPTGRTSNVVAYNSPTFSGFNATLSYAPNSEAAVAGANTDAKIWGATLRYGGVVNLLWDYASNQAASGGANRLKLSGNKLGVGWPYAPGAQVSVIWAQLKNEGVAGAAGFSALNDNIKQAAWTLNWEHVFGNVQALAMYGKLNRASGCTALNGTANGCDNTDAKAYMLGLKYLMSKRTGMYVTYNRVSNSANQIADYSANASYGAAAAIGAGADPRVWAIGMMHNF